MYDIQGSPPRMRGKLDDIPAKQRERRITPADAGKTRYTVSKPSVAQDHPRGCGENAENMRANLHSPGSPPRMRGKPAASLR